LQGYVIGGKIAIFQTIKKDPYILRHKVQNAPSGAIPDMAIARRMGECGVPIFPKIL
jgi:hypothetical protein